VRAGILLLADSGVSALTTEGLCAAVRGSDGNNNDFHVLPPY